MRLHAFTIVVAVASVMVFIPIGSRSETVKVDPKTVIVPRWEGFGCSLSWWGAYTKAWPKDAQREVCRRIFSADKDALGWNICRYNVGGCEADIDEKPFRPGGAIRTVLDRGNVWAPQRDAAQIQCALLAKRFGANIFEMFANTPPYWMLKNGNTRGGDNGTDNLKPECYKEYAQWIVDVAERFRVTYGLRFDYLEPFNEPSAGWWDGAKGGQEGCKLDWSSQAAILNYLKPAIARTKQPYKVTASDENGSREAYNTLEWLMQPDGGKMAPGFIDKLNVHAYWGWEWQDRLRELAAKSKIPKVWMSEVSRRESDNAGFVPYDMRCALGNTRSLVSDVRRLHCSAWIYWQTVEPMQFGLWYHYTYGLLPAAIDKDVDWNGKVFKPGQFVVTKGFYALRQFSAFIRPGDRLIASGDEWSLAAISPHRNTLTVVVHNDEKRSKPYTFDTTGLCAPNAVVRVWRTADDVDGHTYNCAEIGNRRLDKAGRFTDTVPAMSVSTYVVQLLRETPAHKQ